jgi:hypothetical protein
LQLSQATNKPGCGTRSPIGANPVDSQWKAAAGTAIASYRVMVRELTVRDIAIAKHARRQDAGLLCHRHGGADMNTTIRSAALATCVLVATPLIAACASTPTQESTGEFLDDTVITTKVKTKLFQDQTVSGMQVSVETYKGRVFLSGLVDSQNEKAKAEQLALSVPGVKSVSNNLIIKGN